MDGCGSLSTRPGWHTYSGLGFEPEIRMEILISFTTLSSRTAEVSQHPCRRASLPPCRVGRVNTAKRGPSNYEAGLPQSRYAMRNPFLPGARKAGLIVARLTQPGPFRPLHADGAKEVFDPCVLESPDPPVQPGAPLPS